MKSYCPFFVLLLIGLQLLPEAAFAYGTRHATAELVVGTVTAYTSRPDAVTASGALPFDGLLACPRKYPMGTLFKIEGKLYECRDRLSRKYEDRFDIWKSTAIAARLFGKRRLLILAMIPAKKPTLIASGLNVRLARY